MTAAASASPSGIAPAGATGWIIMPFGAAIALWGAFRRVKGDTLRYYARTLGIPLLAGWRKTPQGAPGG